MSTPFTRLLGTTQGRITPQGGALAGSFAFVLGSDVAGVRYTFNSGDKLTLAQVADTTGLKLVRFLARVRAPLALVTDGTWRLQWGVDGAVQAWKDLRPGKTENLADGVIDVSQLAPGNHSLELALLVQV